MDAKTELKEMGYLDTDKLTEEQAEQLILPVWGPENYAHDGEVSPAQAKRIWNNSLRNLGLTTLQIFQANKMYGL